jgi:endonuclease YncB( thermonuclease family)
MFRIGFNGKVTRVLDGDTIEVEVRRTVRVRILDLWCHEIRGGTERTKASGRSASRRMADLVMGCDVAIDIPIDETARFGESMSFGRILANVKTVGAIDVAANMIESGHGWRTKDEFEASKEAIG